MRLKAKLSVFFEEPFWVGLYEREYNGYYEVCKITFGAEPTDGQVYEWLLKNERNLVFSAPTIVSGTEKRHHNPKRVQREIQNARKTMSVGTKAQQALKTMQEAYKCEKKSRSKEQKEIEKTEAFQLRVQKKKQKHRGH